MRRVHSQGFVLIIVTLWSFSPLFAIIVNGQTKGIGSSDKIQEVTGHSIPGVSFQVFLDSKNKGEWDQNQTLAQAAVDTVVKALEELIRTRHEHPRFDQALTQDLLEKVVIEPKVLNRDGKEFPFLVARTKSKGKVKLLINASRLQQGGYLHSPHTLAPRLAKEFQWVISKAATKPKRKDGFFHRDLEQAPIATNAEVKMMSAEERKSTLHALLDTYLQTVDAYHSLANQPYYEMGSTQTLDPTQSDSTTKLYDIRVREALEHIVVDPYFWDHTPKAVRSLLNGKVWAVIMTKIDERDWTTRTRVVPKDKAVKVGERETMIQPAKVLVNYHRTMEKDEPLYHDTLGLPMGALSGDQLAHVIAWEIQSQITEKSMRGHVAEDEKTSLEK